MIISMLVITIILTFIDLTIKLNFFAVCFDYLHLLLMDLSEDIWVALELHNNVLEVDLYNLCEYLVLIDPY